MPIQLKVSIKEQSLLVLQNSLVVKQYAISTAAKGAGEYFGSEQTPRGQHIIRAKIGKNSAINTVFVARRPTGEIYTPQLSKTYPERDWILTRIFWLSGVELGKNRLGKVDTMRRYIYIHGSPDVVEMGKPGSHGCIRMRNEDVMELFDMIPVGTKINVSST